MSELDVLSSSAAGMEAQRAALDVAARNVAAAEASPSGSPFARLVPQFERAEPSSEFGEPDDDVIPPIRFIGTVAQPGTGVDAVTEMVAVLNAQRAYEANASVFDLGKRLAERTIEVGRA
jgi:flagellar basal-body rod protein FlgC